MRKKIVIFVLLVVSECNGGLITGILSGAHDVHKQVQGAVLGGLSQAFNFNVHGQFGVNQQRPPPNHEQIPSEPNQEPPNYGEQDRFPPSHNGYRPPNGQNGYERPHRPHNHRPHNHHHNNQNDNPNYEGPHNFGNKYPKPIYGNQNPNGQNNHMNHNHGPEDNLNGQPEYGNQNNLNRPGYGGQNNHNENQNNYGRPQPEFGNNNHRPTTPNHQQNYRPPFNNNNQNFNNDPYQQDNGNDDNNNGQQNHINFKPTTENPKQPDKTPNYEQNGNQNSNIDKTTKNPDQPLFIPLNPNEYTYGGDKIEVTAPKRDTNDKPKPADEDDEYAIDIRFKDQ
ncbi:GATA zinc finger domain-containing protein 14-like [Bombyx mandarina]|uniref:GATA zinc finger domain-containing protein 14-like n=1 Tax=Bombyx mandarina TaxID=7092 RepID=A0A6J2KKS3_BOMMA|nr:GATA zinc finger domain-containing protein 14-like [Bombyx mandarina]